MLCSILAAQNGGKTTKGNGYLFSSGYPALAWKQDSHLFSMVNEHLRADHNGENLKTLPTFSMHKSHP